MLNPLYRSQLHIYQLEEYSPVGFLKWWITHPFTIVKTAKKPLVFTKKVKTIRRLSFLSTIIIVTLFYLNFSTATSAVVALVLTIFPFLLIILSSLLHHPYEIVNRQFVIAHTRQKLDSLKDLTTIGITGSFGKTSTKNFLFHILDHHQYTVKTPASYNTVFGIEKVVRLELSKKTKYFLPEMGAYVRGEIKELTRMIPPDYAILTAIGTQHLERFKTLENTTRAKFELIDSVDPSKALVNLDNPRIASFIKQPQYKSVNTYSLSNKKADFYLTSKKITPSGTTFTLQHKNKSTTFQTHLFGTSNLQNLVAAISMAMLLDVPVTTINKALTTLKPAPNRLEIKQIDKAIVIDNTYSSNLEGLTSLLADLKDLKGKKAVITPGIVELGETSNKVHRDLGKQLKEIFDTIILVGHSDRTTSLEKGIGKKVDYITQHKHYWPTVNKLARTHSWILLENDLPDQY